MESWELIPNSSDSDANCPLVSALGMLGLGHRQLSGRSVETYLGWCALHGLPAQDKV